MSACYYFAINNRAPSSFCLVWHLNKLWTCLVRPLKLEKKKAGELMLCPKRKVERTLWRAREEMWRHWTRDTNVWDRKFKFVNHMLCQLCKWVSPFWKSCLTIQSDIYHYRSIQILNDSSSSIEIITNRIILFRQRRRKITFGSQRYTFPPEREMRLMWIWTSQGRRK